MNIRKMKDTDIAAVSRIEKLTHIQPWSENVLTDCYHPIIYVLLQKRAITRKS